MKKNLCVAVFVCALLVSCSTRREIQVELMNVQLVRVDTIYRSDQSQKVLTWQTDNHVKYYSFEDLNLSIPVGTFMKVLVKR